MADNASASVADNDKLFENIDGEQRITEIESLCMNCEENGTTRLLLTKIPHFREVVLMAFECPHCGFHNNELQPAASMAEYGIHQSIKVETQSDLNRQIVKSEYASVRFEELDFEIPPNTQKGVLTTIEGMIDRAIENLSQDQPSRKQTSPELHDKLETIIEKLRECMAGKTVFTVTIDDPSGNSYLENLCAPKDDPKIQTRKYRRTREQVEALGFEYNPEIDGGLEPDELPFHEQIHSFPGVCPGCKAPAATKMHMLEIPHFKEVIVMALSCDACGYKSNEVKAGGAISDKGKRITLVMTDTEDLSRDILKSETCGLSIPEVDLELTPGTLGGRFTTIEGLLTQIYEELDKRSQFVSGDSANTEARSQFDSFLAKLRKVLKMEIAPVTLILDDPLANSHLQNPYAPDADPNITIELYDRTWEQNEGLGLNDIKLEDYADDHDNKSHEEEKEEKGEGQKE